LPSIGYIPVWFASYGDLLDAKIFGRGDDIKYRMAK
jgi:hypothetical protein